MTESISSLNQEGIERLVALENENKRLKEEVTRLKRMHDLEDRRDTYVNHVILAASNKNTSRETVMEFVTECARTLYDKTVRAILYEIKPMTGTAYDIIKPTDIEDIVMSNVFYCCLDTSLAGFGKSRVILPEEKRYLSIKNHTVSGDAYIMRKPVSSTNKGFTHNVKHIHEGEYENSRWPDVDQRAAFPFINPMTSKVEYVLVIDKGGEHLTNYDIRFVRDFVKDASLVLAIKQVIHEDNLLYNSVRESLHNLNTARATIEMIIESLEEKYKDKLIERLSSQFERFQRVMEQIRTKKEIHDVYKQDLGYIVKNTCNRTLDIYKHISIDLKIEDTDAFFDKYVMMEAIENIIKNSAETKKESPKINVSITRADEKYCLLRISDDCLGMEPELFDAVIKGPGITTKNQGSGIGIASTINRLQSIGCLVDIYNNYPLGFEYQIMVPTTGENFTKQIDLK